MTGVPFGEGANPRRPKARMGAVRGGITGSFQSAFAGWAGRVTAVEKVLDAGSAELRKVASRQLRASTKALSGSFLGTAAALRDDGVLRVAGRGQARFEDPKPGQHRGAEQGRAGRRGRDAAPAAERPPGPPAP